MLHLFYSVLVTAKFWGIMPFQEEESRQDSPEFGPSHRRWVYGNLGARTPRCPST
jgi:hypothetical protein